MNILLIGLAFKSISDLDKRFDILHETFGLFSPPNKRQENQNNDSKFQVTKPKRYIIKLNDQVIENVEMFRYLGENIYYNQPSLMTTKNKHSTSSCQVKMFYVSSRLKISFNTSNDNQQYFLGHIARQKNTSIVKRLLFNDNTNKQKSPYGLQVSTMRILWVLFLYSTLFLHNRL